MVVAQQKTPSYGDLVGADPAMQDLFRQIESVSQTDVAVLIEGETGVGKDLVAHMIHRRSRRADDEFVRFNVCSLPDEVFESELFGYVRGVFSGADQDHRGLACLADGGSLFIDEVAELSLANQPKLLRFLDSKEVRPVGHVRSTQVDLRIICATNRDLWQAVQCGAFRADLYYRLRIVSLRVPSLRERRDDLPLLIDFFLDKFNRKYRKGVVGIDAQARKLLLGHSWGGNVRELEAEMERAVVFTPCGEAVTSEVLSPQVQELEGAVVLEEEASLEDKTKPEDAAKLEDTGQGDGSTLLEFRRHAEMRRIRAALKRHSWNVSAAARELGISRVGLSRKLSRLGIRRPGREP